MEVKLWARTEQEAQRLNQERQNSTLLSGATFPERLSVTSHIGDAVEGAALVIWATPAQTMRDNVRVAKDYLEEATLLMSAAKGLEVGTGKRMSQVIAEEIAFHLCPNICVLSGPNLAREIARGLPAVSVVAAKGNAVAEKARQILSAPNYYLFISNDVIGVELGGALKNIIALGAGIIDGLELGDNAKAAFITCGWAEITALGIDLGANHLTFSGPAGLGDLIATCASPLSRNHYVGMEIAKGRPLAEVTASTPHVAEGVTTVIAALDLAGQFKVEMPITKLIYRVLFQGLELRQARAELVALFNP